MDTPRFVFIAEGKLFLQEGSSAPREIESPFAKAAMARAEERQNRHAWKNGDAEIFSRDIAVNSPRWRATTSMTQDHFKSGDTITVEIRDSEGAAIESFTLPVR